MWELEAKDDEVRMHCIGGKLETSPDHWGGRGRPGSELWGPSGAHTSESREIWVTWAEVFGFYLFLTDFIFRSILGLHKKIAQKIQWILTSLLPWHMDSSVISILHSVQFSSVAQSCLTLWPHELQHARPPCPSPTPEVYSNSCPSSGWCHPAISSSVAPFSSCPQSLPASGSFPVNQLFSWGDQSTGVSASASVLPMNT